MTHKGISIFIIAVQMLVSITAFSQSYSGNVNSNFDKNALSYGNVDIYKGKKLIASVLTDKEGNFNIKLDTGTYRCVIQYAGYEKIEKDIKIVKDEKAVISMNVDTKSEYKPTLKPNTTDATETLSIAKTGGSKKHVYSPSFGGSYSDSYEEHRGATTGYSEPRVDTKTIRTSIVSGARYGVITAGELNDFSKWVLWQDMVKSVLENCSKFWELRPNGRYAIQIMSAIGIPIADAHVYLKNKNNTIIYQSKTDNTGKAELWATLGLDTINDSNKLQLEVHYKGIKEVVKNAKPISKGYNSLIIDVMCNQPQVVDIAFVVDATGSMGDEIDFLKAELNEVIFKSKEISTTLDFRFGSVFYRDHGDQYLTRTKDFSRVLSESISFINNQSAAGGGDYEEAVEIGLDSAINGLSWSSEARARILFLILDAPPHNTLDIRIKLEKLMRDAAAKGIRIVPLVASGINKNTEYLMRSMALATNGTYVFLTNHSGVGAKHIEPTTDNYKVELLSKLLVRILKSYTYMPDCQKQMPNLNLTYPDSVVIYPNQQQVSSDDSLTIKKDTSVNTKPTVSWKYFPNPAREYITVITDRDIEELYITDLSGKALKVEYNLVKDQPKLIYLGDFATGIYLIRYRVDDFWLTGKVVVTR